MAGMTWMQRKENVKKKLIAIIMVIACGLLSGCSESEDYFSDGEFQSAMVDRSPLIVYHSLAGEVEEMAYEIGSITGGKCVSLDTKQPYPEDEQKRTEKFREELEQNILPELKPIEEELDAYDTVYIGSYLWEGGLPPAVRAFLAQDTLSGKTVIPFGVAEQAGDETVKGFEQMVRELCPGAEVRDGFLMQNGETAQQTSVLGWLAGNGQVIPIHIQAGETELTGILFSNPTSEEFAGKLPLEVPLYEPADFAKAFNLQEPLRDPGIRTRLFELGGIAYWPEGPAVAIFFSDHVDRTVVPVYTLGKVLEDAPLLREYEGSITITLAEKFADITRD